MTADGPHWPPPTGSPAGTSGWYLASDGDWYRTDVAPAPGYVLGDDGRWRPANVTERVEPELWRTSRWGLGDAWWGALVYVVVGLAVGGAFLFLFGEGDDGEDFGVYATSAFVAINTVGMLAVPWLATRRKGLRSLRLDFGLRGRPMDLLIGLGFGIAALIGAAIVTNAIDAALGAEEATSNVPIDGLDGPLQFMAFFVTTAVMTPIVEEVFFRGLIYRSFLKRGTGTVMAIASTTVIFVLPHLLAAESGTEVAAIAGAIAVLGVAFNLASHVTGNRLAAPIVAHALVNAIAVIALAT